MPVSARTSAVLPWSMWPAVPTIMLGAARRLRAGRGRPPRAVSAASRGAQERIGELAAAGMARAAARRSRHRGRAATPCAEVEGGAEHAPGRRRRRGRRPSPTSAPPPPGRAPRRGRCDRSCRDGSWRRRLPWSAAASARRRASAGSGGTTCAFEQHPAQHVLRLGVAGCGGLGVERRGAARILGHPGALEAGVGEVALRRRGSPASAASVSHLTASAWSCATPRPPAKQAPTLFRARASPAWASGPQIASGGGVVAPRGGGVGAAPSGAPGVAPREAADPAHRCRSEVAAGTPRRPRGSAGRGGARRRRCGRSPATGRRAEAGGQRLDRGAAQARGHGARDLLERQRAGADLAGAVHDRHRRPRSPRRSAGRQRLGQGGDLGLRGGRGGAGSAAASARRSGSR